MSQIKTDSAFLVLYSDNISKTYDFYFKLGAVIEQIENDKCVVNLCGHSLHIINSESEPFPEYFSLTLSKSRGQCVLFYFEVDDIVTFMETVKNVGGEVITSIKENHWGAIECLFKDPNGYNLIAYEMIT
jgi:hypothetical protein